MKKSQNMLVWLSKMVFGLAFQHSLLRLGKKAQRKVTSAVERLDSLIDPGGVMLVVFLQSPF